MFSKVGMPKGDYNFLYISEMRRLMMDTTSQIIKRRKIDGFHWQNIKTQCLPKIWLSIERVKQPLLWTNKIWVWSVQQDEWHGTNSLAWICMKYNMNKCQDSTWPWHDNAWCNLVNFSKGSYESENGEIIYIDISSIPPWTWHWR